MLSNSGNLGRYFGVKTVPYTADVFLKEGDTEIGGIKFRTIYTPGHTAGSVSYYIPQEGVLLSGDTLFYGSFGRTDFPTGNFNELKNSIKEKLFALPPDTKVYAGHGEPTTIGEEIKYNSINEY